MILFDKVLEFIFPTKCFSCGSEENIFCSNCIAVLMPAERQCARWIFPVFDYRQPAVKRAVWLLKYKNKRKPTVMTKMIIKIPSPCLLKFMSFSFSNPDTPSPPKCFLYTTSLL